MIEMIYKGTSKNGEQEERKSLPKNVRQIGETEKDKRVYIEDYAATFLEGTDCAVLLGEIWQNGNMKCLFVDGAVKVEGENFEESVWEKVYREINTYFPGREILGWARSTDNQEEELPAYLTDIHREQFPGEDKLLVWHGPEGSSIYLTESTGIKKQPGYYIYYEKNEQMQSYMVKENEGKSVEAEEDVPDNAIKSFRKRIAQKREHAQQTEEQTYKNRTPLMVRFLYGASMFLVLTILVIGVTMVNNYNRMKDMEMTLSEIAEGALEDPAEDAASLAVNETTSLAVNETTSPAGNETTFPAVNEAEKNAALTEMETNMSETDSIGQSASELQNGETQQTESAASENRAAQASSPEVRNIQAAYTVREGDTLATVCRMYYGNLDKLEEICILNDIEDPNTILPGQKLVLP